MKRIAFFLSSLIMGLSIIDCTSIPDKKNSNLGVTWTIVDEAFGSAIHDIAYGNGMFVAVTSNGEIVYSNDGISWAVAGEFKGNTLYSIAYGGNRFVAGGSRGILLYSDDGINWTKLPDSPFEIPYGVKEIAYAGGRFFAGTYGGDIPYSNEMAYSDDGINWTAFTPPPRYGIRNITYGGGRFVATSVWNTILYSNDGIHWTDINIREVAPQVRFGYTYNGSIGDITYGDDKFVAVGSYIDNMSIATGGRIVISSDGINWSGVSSGVLDNIFVGEKGINNIAYGGNRFVAAGDKYVIAYSDDGINWTASASPFSAPSQYSGLRINCIAYGNGKFVVGWGYRDVGRIAYSPAN